VELLQLVPLQHKQLLLARLVQRMQQLSRLQLLLLEVV
jgi:hypothetical protein